MKIDELRAKFEKESGMKAVIINQYTYPTEQYFNWLERQLTEIKLFNPQKNKPKPSKDDITFSEDVYIIDEDGMHGLAYYSFEDEKWRFHTDTLVDYDEPGNETKWLWYYPPVDLTMALFK